MTTEVSVTELADQAAALVRDHLLTGPPKRVTKDVEHWAATLAQRPDDDATLLEHYAQEKRRRDAEALEQWTDLAGSADGRAALLRLVNRRQLVDAGRLLALEALATHAPEVEVAELARVSLNQRPDVRASAARLLAAIGGAESAFVLRKALGRNDDEAGMTARALADELTSEGEVGFYELLALPPEEQLTRWRALDEQARAHVDEVASDAERVLREAGRVGSAGSDFHVLFREELHAFALLTGIGASADLQRLARNTLFKRGDLARVAELAPRLDSTVVMEYCRRALLRANRRGERADRALFALQLLTDDPRLDPSVLFDDLRDALVDDLPEMRARAAALLASQPDRLEPADRSVLTSVFNGLPADLQDRLASVLGQAALGDSEEMSLAALVRWVSGAEASDARQRISAAAARWRTSELIPGNAAKLLDAMLRAADSLDLEDRRVVDTQIASVVVDRLDAPDFLEVLRASEPARTVALNGVRRLVERAGARAGAVLDADIELLSAQPAVGALPDDLGVARSAVRRSLTRAMVDRDDDWDAAFEAAALPIKRVMIGAALSATRELGRRSVDAQLALDGATATALIRAREALAGALGAASAAAQGNDAFTRQLDAIETAVAVATAEDAVVEVPRGVLAWKASLESGSSPDYDGLAPDRLVEIVDELDRRANTRGTNLALERPFFARELERAVASAVKRGLLEHISKLTHGRPALMRILWTTWASERPDLPQATSRLLGDAAEAGEQRAVIGKLDAFVDRLAAQEIPAAVEPLADEALGGAWGRVTPLLALRRRALSALESATERQDDEVMARVARELELPFRVIEGILFGYFRLRRILADAGFGQVPVSLGDLIDDSDIDPRLHRIVGVDAGTGRYVVRSLGIVVGDEPVVPAVVEALPADEEETE